LQLFILVTEFLSNQNLKAPMFELIQFPSVIEGNNVELREVAPDLLNGLKLLEKRRAYVIGNLALTEGVSPHKNINSSPGELEYQLLMKAGLLLAADKLGKNRLTVTTGFPTSTYQLYREQAVNIIQKEHIVEFDQATYSTGMRRNLPVAVDKVQVMPEIQGCILGLRKGETKAAGNFFVVSLGFGTCEAIMSTETGTIQRTAISTNGLRYAVNLLMNELGKQYYLELKNEHQLDVAFQKGFLFSNRKRVDLREVRERVLQQYYQDVISPALRKAFVDTDFQSADKMYLVGGGAHYEELLAQFKQEFHDIVEIIVPNDPASLASKGYCINSMELNGGDISAAIGLDLGNATTILSMGKTNTQKKVANQQHSEQANGSDQRIAKVGETNGQSSKSSPAAVVNESVLGPQNSVHDTNKMEDDPMPRSSSKSSSAPQSKDRLGKFLKTGMW
jgi:plasmid segregation protein ParM